MCGSGSVWKFYQLPQFSVLQVARSSPVKMGSRCQRAGLGNVVSLQAALKVQSRLAVPHLTRD